jgi:multidrug efflux pump subunit AcrA (membrane-fusion protein)
MRKTGLCGVVIATLFGTAGLLQHPSHQVHIQHKQQTHVSSSPFAEAGVNLLNSYEDLLGLRTGNSVTPLPDGFLRIMLKPGPSPAQIAAYLKLEEERHAMYEQALRQQQEATAQAEAQAQQQAEEQAEAQAQAQAAAQAQAEAEAQAQAAQQSKSSSTPSGGVWLELRDCESGDNYATDTGNGYYGAYQFLLSTWEDLGFSGLPSSASPATQDQAAQELQARSGWGQWPACAAELGLT